MNLIDIPPSHLATKYWPPAELLPPSDSQTEYPLIYRLVGEDNNIEMVHLTLKPCTGHFALPNLTQLLYYRA